MISRFESEKCYKDPNKNNATYPFPFMEEEGSIDLAVIVPSYNEEERCEYRILFDQLFHSLSELESLCCRCSFRKWGYHNNHK